jgi:MFS family permease
MNLYDAIEVLAKAGIVDIFLPFMLIFVIVFAVLQKTKILGTDEDKKKFNVILALIMALSVVIPHALGRYSPKSDPVLLINNILPNIALVMLAVIAFLLIVGVFGREFNPTNGGIAGIITIFAVLAVLVTFGVAAGWFGQLPWWLGFLEDEATQVLFVTILITGIIIALITGGGEKNKNPHDSPFGKFFSDVFKDTK